MAAAKSNVDAAQATLNLASIIAPIDGTVTQVGSLVGDQVATGDLAFRVDDLSGLLVDVDVSEVDINSVASGQPASLDARCRRGENISRRVWKQVSQAGDVTSGGGEFHGHRPHDRCGYSRSSRG